jgi:hypothetical protein
VSFLRLGDRLAYHNRSWYDLTHILKVCDAPFDTLYNASTIVRGGTFMVRIENVPGGNYEYL